jgi:DivIVA domain-containing protein
MQTRATIDIENPRRDVEVSMTLSPEQIEQVTFTKVKQGYDVGEVHGFLHALAAQLRTADDFDRAGGEVAAALRGMHHLLVEMKQNAEEEIERSRREAAEETDRMRAEAKDEVDRLRADAQWHHDQLIGEAEVKAQQMIDEASELRAEADQVAQAIDHTVRAKRKEIENYVVSLSARAEELARGRIDEVLENHRAALSQLAESRVEAAETLRRAQRLIESALGVVLTDLDLTEPESQTPELSSTKNFDAEAPFESLAREIASDGMTEAQAIIDATSGSRTS